MLEILKRNWKNHFVYLDLNSEFKDKHVLNSCEIAILLSVNKENYERYLSLNDFTEILRKIGLRIDIYSLELAQVQSLNAIKMGFVAKNEILRALEILNQIADNTDLIELIQAMQTKQIDKKQEFFSTFNGLNIINEKIQNLNVNEKINLKLQNASDKFKNIQFSIAVTGVMNAGKSSMLNALLKTELLGVSNVPETANLTLIKYGQEEKVKIYFWNKKEWNNILESADCDDEIKNFVSDISKELPLDNFIKDNGFIKEIAITEIKNFTSAKNKISALIKKIEINSSLEFLKDNVSIVDTPGLDDVIIQREIVTNEHIKESDFLIHLMNASQSLSQKDSDFIISCLLNSRLSKILIIVTKADLLEKKDLNEVIFYTRETLKSKLKFHGIDENLIEKIDFLSISAKKANDFYAKKATRKELEESHILELEQYLMNELFSNNKTKIALQAYKKELLLISEQLIQGYELENTIINNKHNNLSKENQDLLVKFTEEQEKLAQAKEDIHFSISNLEDQKDKLENLFFLLGKKLKEKLMDELKYTKEKKMKLNFERILSIVEITLKDGVNDILRDVKFENLKKIESIKEYLSKKYDFLQENLNNNFDDFKNKLTKNIEDIFNDEKYALFRLKIQSLLKQEKDINFLEKKLEEDIDVNFSSFDFDKMLKELNLNEQFLDFLNLKLNEYENLQKKKLSFIKDSMDNSYVQEKHALKIYKDNVEKIECLKHLKVDIQNAN